MTGECCATCHAPGGLPFHLSWCPVIRWRLDGRPDERWAEHQIEAAERHMAS